jgi:hypothetical protein
MDDVAKFLNGRDVTSRTFSLKPKATAETSSTFEVVNLDKAWATSFFSDTHCSACCIDAGGLARIEISGLPCG